MKTFSESRKSDRSHITGKAVAPPVVKEATPPTEVVAEEKGSESVTPPKGSPRNLDILKKLGTRERGSKGEKKPSSSSKKLVCHKNTAAVIVKGWCALLLTLICFTALCYAYIQSRSL